MSGFLYLAQLSYTDVECLDKKRAVILLPMGPVEAHGPHLPLGVDITGAVTVTEMAARKLADKGYLPVIAPTMPYTLADVAFPFAGTVTLKQETVISFTLDLAKSFARHGFRYFVIFCHHGERPNLHALSEAAEEAARDYGIQVLVSNALIDGMQKLGDILEGEHPQMDFHAGEFETSLYLWQAPDLVKTDIAKNLPPVWSNLREVFPKGARDFIEAGAPLCYLGDPAKASAEKGKRVYERLSEMLMVEVERFLQQDRSKKRGTGC
jgi:creatinine amidohydrolase